MTTDEVLLELQILEKKCPCRFVVVVGRRKAEDDRKLPPGTSRSKGDMPLDFECDFDCKINRLIKNFLYYDLKLSNSSFSINDNAHQTPHPLKQCEGKMLHYYSKKNNFTSIVIALSI